VLLLKLALQAIWNCDGHHLAIGVLHVGGEMAKHVVEIIEICTSADHAIPRMRAEYFTEAFHDCVPRGGSGISRGN
jgi:hypothetical protein